MTDVKRHVDLYLHTLPGSPRGTGQATLSAPGQPVAQAPVDLRLHNLALPGVDMQALDFLRHWSSGAALGLASGLAFGRVLLERLLPTQAMRRAWRRALRLQGRAQGPRLALHLEPDDPLAALELPYELLADDDGFLTRAGRVVLVRVLTGWADTGWPALPSDAGLTVAWANPRGGMTRLRSGLLTEHERLVARATADLGLAMQPACRQASLSSLIRHGQAYDSTLLSLIAHGAESGSGVWLHADEREQARSGHAELVSASRLAGALRASGTQVAFLWTCHGARSTAAAAALSQVLLDPAQGALHAVVAAQGALHAAHTAPAMAALLDALGAEAQAPLASPLALAEAVALMRQALPEDDLQWAAPVLFVRSLSAGPTGSAPRSTARGGMQRDLPARPVYFRGREVELTATLARLRRARLVVLVGAPGVGKTALAAEVIRRALAYDLVKRAPVWVELDAVSDEMALVSALEAALGDGSGASVGTPSARLVRLAASLGEPAPWCVLDNAEDLLAAAPQETSTALRTLLAHSPHVRLLVTTRPPAHAIPTPAANVLPVHALDRQSAREVFAAIMGRRASARSAEAQAALDWADGHPQCLVLMAHHMRAGGELPPTMRVAGRELPAWQAARATLEHLAPRLAASLDATLSPLLARQPLAMSALIALAHLPGGLSAGQLRLLLGPGAHLCRQALLDSGVAHEHGRDRRLTLPVPFRGHAAALLTRLSAADQAALLARAWRAVGAGLRAERRQMQAAVGRAAWAASAVPPTTATPAVSRVHVLLRRAQQDSVNARALADLCLAHATAAAPLPAWAAAATATLGAWSYLLVYTGRVAAAWQAVRDLAQWVDTLSDGERGELERQIGDVGARAGQSAAALRAYEHALAACRRTGDAIGEAHAHMASGELHLRLARYAEARAACERALAIYRHQGLKHGAANAQRALGDAHFRQAQYAAAHARYTRALEDYDQVGAVLGSANTWRALGDVALRGARFADARHAFQQARWLFEQIDNDVGIGNALLSLGDVALRTQQLEEARVAYDEALARARAAQDSLGCANALQMLGDVAQRQYDWTTSQHCYRAALELYEALGDDLGRANTLKGLGEVLATLRQRRAALRAYAEALVLFRTLRDPLGEANTLNARGETYLAAGRLARAAADFDAARGLYAGVGARLGLASSLLSLGRLSSRRRQHVAAQAWLEPALEQQANLHDPVGLANTLLALGELCMATRDHASARQRLAQAEALFREHGLQRGIGHTQRALALLALRRRDLPDAREHLVAALLSYDQVGVLREACRARERLAHLELRRGHGSAARTCLERALNDYEERGEERDVERVRQALARLE
jgi:tetratricopeptide (TPR) repeat protein